MHTPEVLDVEWGKVASVSLPSIQPREEWDVLLASQLTCWTAAPGMWSLMAGTKIGQQC